MTLVYGLMTMTVLTGFVSFGVDFGRVQLAKTELQQAADAAARYGAGAMSLGPTTVQNRIAASALENKIDGTALVIDKNADIEFGVWNPSTKTFVVKTGSDRNSATAVRVTARRSTARGTAVPLIFGRLFGRATIDMKATAIVARGNVTSQTFDADSSPWLAGMPNNATVPGTDGNTTPARAPAQSPSKVNGVDITPGNSLFFRDCDGMTSYEDAASYGPDGNTDWIVAQTAVNGINTTSAPLNSVVGIFLDDRAPNTWGLQTAGNFSSANSRDFTTLSPKLKQVFFIGDGVNSAGELQEFVVPAGATRLYIGLMDEKGWWWDNTGTISTTLMDDKITLVK